MSCFPCFTCKKNLPKEEPDNAAVVVYTRNSEVPQKSPDKQQKSSAESPPNRNGNTSDIAAQAFTFRELASATKNFRPDCLIGEGGFGRVYKGVFEKTGQVVAVKQLDRHGMPAGSKEFLVEVLMLSLLNHPNLVKFVGYCADGDQRVLVYEFMSGGTLEDHLFDLQPDKKPLSWHTRLKLAWGAAQGLEYLHEKANPPVIYRDLKSSNILLDEELNPKLSDVGLAKLGPTVHMGTYGYCAPEYSRAGDVTVKSDVYSFGVVLLELITGRRAMDTTKPTNEQNLVTWAQPMFRDQKRYHELVDPLLQGEYPAKTLNQVVAVAAMCLQEEASVRPLIADVVVTLSFLCMEPPIGSASTTPAQSPSPSHTPLPEVSESIQEMVAEENHPSDHSNSGDESSEDGDADDYADSHKHAHEHDSSDVDADSQKHTHDCDDSDSESDSDHGHEHTDHSTASRTSSQRSDGSKRWSESSVH